MTRVEVGFAAYAVAAAGAGWLLASYAAEMVLPAGRLALMTLVTIVLFPAVRFLFVRQEVVLEREREQ
jgi:hypothetical protein